jgi:hypothetical protein
MVASSLFGENEDSEEEYEEEDEDWYWELVRNTK